MIEARFRLSRPGFSTEVGFSAGTGVTALFGPSGSGKTTILDCIAGLARPDEGRISVDGTVFFDADQHIDLPPHRRHAGYVFQDPLLFPHLTVAQNLRYGASPRSGPGFDEMVQLLGIAALLSRRPAKLSGGERQRVAIGRALLSAPRFLLMDEPLAALDIDRKREILPYIEALRERLRLPILYVSHAVDEVARLADQVLVIEAGRIVARGPPEQALAPHLHDGESRFDRVSVLTARALAHDEAYGLTPLLHAAGRISIAGRVAEGRDIRIVIRATDVTLATAPPQQLSMRTALTGRVAAIESNAGPVAIASVALEGGQLLAAAATRKAIDELHLAPGTPVWCLIKAVSIDERWLRSG